jgi:RNA polymerase sigma factor (sigma-70 family)
MRKFPGGSEAEALVWMRIVVKHCAWRIAKRRHKRQEISAEVSEEELGISIAEERRGPAQLVEAGEDVERFLGAMAQLRPDERRALLLIAAGYSYAEIGRICGWTRTKINRCAAEGRSRLRVLLAETGEKP